MNHAELLDGLGHKVLDHLKLAVFSRPLPADSPFKDVPPELACEAISTGTVIQALDTPLGLFVAPICLDFCDSRTRPFDRIWNDLGPEWLLVPSMGEESTLSAHTLRAKEMDGIYRSVVIVANQMPDGKDALHGFVAGDRGDNSFKFIDLNNRLAVVDVHPKNKVK